MKHLLLGVAFAVSTCACSGGGFSTPIAPAAPRPTYTVAGVVTTLTSDGPAPVARVRVEVSGGPSRFTTTDTSGAYIIEGVDGATTVVSASKAGYQNTSQNVTLSGDARIDLRLVPIPSYTISGIVFEMTAAGRAPIDADLYCDSCGEVGVGHTFAHTDVNGFYRF